MLFINSFKSKIKSLENKNPKLYECIKLIYKKIYNNKFFHYSKHYFRYKFIPIISGSYSQYGEDKIIDKLLGYKSKGFFIDIGANRPKMMNNTYMFYKRGWRGINIEPQTNLYNQFIKSRKDDINLNVGVGNSNGDTFEFYVFKEDELSTFSRESKEIYIERGHKFDKVLSIEIISLNKIIDKYSNKFSNIDFLSIDVEGFEMEVMKSYDWRIKPQLIVLESNGQIKNGQNVISEHLKFLENHGYFLAYFNGLNSFFLLGNK